MNIDESIMNQTILLETFYSCMLNNTNELFAEKIFTCLLPFIHSYREKFTEDYRDTYLNILKHCIQYDHLSIQLKDYLIQHHLENDEYLQILFKN